MLPSTGDSVSFLIRGTQVSFWYIIGCFHVKVLVVHLVVAFDMNVCLKKGKEEGKRKRSLQRIASTRCVDRWSNFFLFFPHQFIMSLASHPLLGVGGEVEEIWWLNQITDLQFKWISSAWMIQLVSWKVDPCLFYTSRSLLILNWC